MPDNDFHLNAAAGGGRDRLVLDELVRQFLPMVRAVILPMVGDAATADDLTQETFLRALKNLSRFEGRSEFGTWLVKIAMNVTRDHLRRIVNRPRAGLSELDELPARGQDVLQLCSSRESLDDIALALQQLPDPLRMALTLVTINGMTPAEAAQLENCTTATIYYRIHQARKLLKTTLSKKSVM